jgi:HK97 family phage portal protein
MANKLQSLARWLVGAEEQRQWNDTDAGWFTPVSNGGIHVDEHTALTFSAVFACETLIADSISTLPVDTYRKSEDRRVETTPPRWLETPNPEVDRIDYDTQRILSLLGWGDAVSLITRENGSSDPMAPVLERWVVEPWRVQFRRVDGVKATFIDGKFVPAGNIQHIPAYLLPGALSGMGPVSQARQSLQIGLQADQYAAKFYENGVVPSGVLEVPNLPADVSKEVVERLRDSFQERYAGTGNARKPLVLTGGTTWSQITMNPADAQFLETRKFQIEEVCRWFRVPPHKIQQIGENASQGGGQGLEQQALEFAQDGLLPWTIRLERADSKLLPRGQYVRYNLNAYVRADIKTRHEVYALRKQIGMNNSDELRALEDEPPIGGRAGEVYWMPANMLDADAEPTEPAPALVPSGSEEEDGPE